MYDVLIVGGGIVGLATAWRLLETQPDLRLALFEKENRVAAHQTGHNSGVIHSGVYYKPGSLKAINCTEGYTMLLDFCNKNDVPYELCGKVIVATKESELPALDMIFERGQTNGLEGMRKIGPEEIREIEPHCTGIAGIRVPQTGIIDYSQVAEKLAECIRALGGEIYLNHRITHTEIAEKNIRLSTENKTYEGKQLINCAGLHSDRIAAQRHKNLNLRIIPFRGEYYKLKPEKRSLVKHLIYPVPNTNFPFLGVHFTRMMSGEVEAGPNAVLAYAREGYTKKDIRSDELFASLMWPGFRKVAFKYWQVGLGELYRSYSKAAFTKALQQLVPEVQESDLITAEAGVRAQACDRKGGLLDDFHILQSEYAIDVLNAPSPAATSSLSIGKKVADLYFEKVGK
jgi:L-2-hydroxyglutarate oxidase